MAACLVLSADLHLATHAWAQHPGIAGDAYFGFEQLVDYCLLHHLPLVLAGDLFDKTRPDPVTIAFARQQLERMGKAGLHVYYIQGQHEMHRVCPWLRAISGQDLPVVHLHRNFCEIGGLTIVGLDWTPQTEVRQALADVPAAADVLIAHQVWTDIMPKAGECAFGDVPYVKLMCTGDFHSHYVKQAVGASTQPLTVCSPGPTCMQSINEDPNKAFFVLHDDLTLESVPLRCRKLTRVTVNSGQELDLLLHNYLTDLSTPQSNVPAVVATPILHVEYRDDIPDAYIRLRTAVTQAHLFTTPLATKDDSAQPLQAPAELSGPEPLVACLDLVAPPDSRLSCSLKQLYYAQDPAAELKRMRLHYQQVA